MPENIASVNNDFLFNSFRSHFKSSPAILINAPGRVNLIGEHTDYNGCPVLPISIASTIAAVVSPRSDRVIQICNSQSHYEPYCFELEHELPHSPQGHWSNYVKAAAEILFHRFEGRLRGFDALFHGSIPRSAGLSSSSALVIASALALLAANTIDMEPINLAELMAVGERYVGTQGGGMDQAVCLLGQHGKAVKLYFFPLRHSYIPFSSGHSIIVAHSLVHASKTKNTLFKYNSRPAECRLATAFINGYYKPAEPLERLGDLPKYGFFRDHPTIESFLSATFDRDTYFLRDIAAVTGKPGDELTSRYLKVGADMCLPEPPSGFFLQNRVRHVLTEAARVESSCDALCKNNVNLFGKLMNESHESCDQHYGLSTPELNVLVTIMRKAGALGARLTGAGFGGCAIALVRDENIQTVMKIIREEYYCDYMKKHRPDLLKKHRNIDDTMLFTVKPSQGAVVTLL